MKKLILLLTVISIFAKLNAQDIIIKKTGDEVKVKITEVGLDNVKYKKYDNIDGPIYTIPKYEIFMIKYENGSKDVFKDIKKEVASPEVEKNKKDYLRKGLHLGFHITPGAGAILMDNYKFGFGINSGVDLSIYFNDYVGIKTGISYLNLPIKYDGYGYYGYDEVTGSIASLGIPIKFLLTTGKTVGFYLESGLNVYFPISSKVEDSYYYYNDNHESVVLAAETVLGLNIKASKIMSLNFGLSFHSSLTKNFPNENTKGVLVGLQMGMLFNLTK